MTRNNKAGYRLTHGSSSNEKLSMGNQRRFFNTDYKHFPAPVQCRFCGSDYMRFAVNGFCQRCQQRAEFVIRERSGIEEQPREGGLS